MAFYIENALYISNFLLFFTCYYLPEKILELRSCNISFVKNNI